MSAPVQSNHSGAEGIVVCNGIDWEVQSWNATETTNSEETTCTSNYDPVTKRTWTRRAATTTDVAGSFEYKYNSLNDATAGSPNGPLTPGQVVAISLTKTSGHTLTGNVFIDSLGHSTNGPGSLQTQTVNFHNQDDMTWS